MGVLTHERKKNKKTADVYVDLAFCGQKKNSQMITFQDENNLIWG